MNSTWQKKRTVACGLLCVMSLVGATYAGTIGYVVDPDRILDQPFDQFWVDHLMQQGHEVIVVGDADGPDFAPDAEFFIISGDVDSGTAGGNWGLDPRPLINHESAAFDEFGMSSGNANSAGTTIDIVDPSHPLAAGFSGTVQVLSSAQPRTAASTNNLAPGMEIIATVNGNPTIGIIEEGAELAPTGPFQAGDPAPGIRMVLFFEQSQNGNNYTNDGIALLDAATNFLLTPPEPFLINGGGETYFQDFDVMETAKRLPEGWSGEDIDGSGRRIDSLGLVDGPLDGAVESAAGIVNVGGNSDRFSTPADGRIGTWKDDLDGNGVFGEADVVADGAVDRALGNGRVLDDDIGRLFFEIGISENPLRAFVADWDLEVWGGDPEAAFRGAEGGGYTVDLSVGGTSYYSDTVSLLPGDLFDSSFDGSPGATHDPTLINGNEHAVRGNSSGIVEVSPADGAVGNLINLTFDADHGGSDGGWIQAVDNVLFRALAAGDAQGDGDVDPADLIQLLAGGAFGQGNIDATWGQGDFDNDGDFDGTDILRVVQGLAGEFPKTYAHDPGNGVPDVLINPATGNITLDTNGTTIGSIVMDSVAGIFNGPNSPSWDAPGDFAADIDTQISMPISFTNPGYTGVDDLGDGIIGDLAPGFDILADLTIKYLDPNGDLLDAEAHVVPEPSTWLLLVLGSLALIRIGRRRFE